MATNSRAYNRAYYLANRERRKAQALAWYHKNKGERMKTQRKRLSDDSRSADVEERSTTQEKLRAIKSRSLFDFARSVYPKGVYSLVIRAGKEVQVRKIVVE
jgi:outer membrane protein OmpA-like peptidoglycan-associated protein